MSLKTTGLAWNTLDTTIPIEGTPTITLSIVFWNWPMLYFEMQPRQRFSYNKITSTLSPPQKTRAKPGTAVTILGRAPFLHRRRKYAEDSCCCN
jgi:hypothetical protein